MLLFQLFYLVISSLILGCVLPLIVLIAIRGRYGRRLVQRLGFGLRDRLRHTPGREPHPGPIIWIHALSVGEVTSSLPLVRSLRQRFPQAHLVFSATTRSGSEVAAALLPTLVDALVAGPLDLGPVVPYYLRTIRPDLFLLVETDFWPHWLLCLHRRRVPLLLVNGRISAASFVRYRHLQFLFCPMFAVFDLLSMQTANDARKMRELGVDPARIATLGNLKFDTRQTENPPGTREAMKQRYGFAPDALLWICGSTHAGEEEELLRIYGSLLPESPGLQLLLAPRNIERSGKILALAAALGFSCRCRSTDRETPGALLLLDSIGELAACYAMADVVFVGGSLVPCGGHNPLEPAAAGVAVLFGPHMEDFSEIAEELVRLGGARQVENATTLQHCLDHLLADPGDRRTMGSRAGACVVGNQGVADRHAEVIARLLDQKEQRQ